MSGSKTACPCSQQGCTLWLQCQQALRRALWTRHGRFQLTGSSLTAPERAHSCSTPPPLPSARPASCSVCHCMWEGFRKVQKQLGSLALLALDPHLIKARTASALAGMLCPFRQQTTLSPCICRLLPSCRMRASSSELMATMLATGTAARIRQLVGRSRFRGR